MPQRSRVPDLQAQRVAMSKLAFLIGKWHGEARLMRGTGEPAELLQTEEARYNLGGLILLIEGVGRTKSGSQPLLQALGIISYDDETLKYHLRAFNDGRFLETQLQLLENGRGMTWSFVFGDITTHSLMHINDDGDWTELAEITIGSQPPQRLLELTVHPQK